MVMLPKRLDTERGHWVAKITDLLKWDKNPRNHDDAGLLRLKKQICRLGIYKPNFVDNQGQQVGGNKRLLAYNDLNTNEFTYNDDNGNSVTIDKRGQFDELWISEVAFTEEGVTQEQINAGQKPRYKAILDGQEQETWFESIEQAMIEYGISDNDEIGSWDKKALHALIQPHKLIPLPMYQIQVQPAISLQTFSQNPNKITDTPSNQEIDPNKVKKELNVKCPKCGFDFKGDEDDIEVNNESASA
jgi:hypothetical protein